MNKTDIPHGFIPDAIDYDHYVFGTQNSSEKKVLNPDRQWTPPRAEKQLRNGVETMGCTVFNTHNALESLLKFQYNVDFDASDRYLNILAGTTPRGNSPHKVAETLRKYTGMIPENTLGFTESIDTWEEYYSGILWGHKRLGLQHLYEWEITHDWVFIPGSDLKSRQEAMWDALQFSPLGVSVDAWVEDNGIYVKRGPDNHWTSIIGGKKGHYWLCFDSYAPFIKKLDWNYAFDFVKMYTIKPRENKDLQFLVRAYRGLYGLY